MDYESYLVLQSSEVEAIREWAETRLEQIAGVTLPGSPEALIHFLPPVPSVRNAFLEACQAGVPPLVVLGKFFEAITSAFDPFWEDDEDDDIDDDFDLAFADLVPAA